MNAKQRRRDFRRLQACRRDNITARHDRWIRRYRLAHIVDRAARDGLVSTAAEARALIGVDSEGWRRVRKSLDQTRTYPWDAHGMRHDRAR